MEKCGICGIKGVFKLNNPGAEVQVFCNVHLPWFINRKAFPAHLTVLNDPKPAPVKETTNESRKNSNKASAPSAEPSADAEGTLPTGSTGGTEDSSGLPETV